MYMLRRDYEMAVPFYAEIYQRQKNGTLAPYIHWKTAWLTYRLGKMRGCAAALYRAVGDVIPDSPEVSAALYWLGRMAEDDGNKPLARAYYQKLTENYRYFYHANLAHARMANLGEEAVDLPMLKKLPGLAAPPRDWDLPADNIRAQKAQLLANAALYEFAVTEMQAASAGSPPWEAKSSG